MKKYFEEYGFIILTCVVVILLIGITIGVKPLMADSLSDITNTWGLKAQELVKNSWDNIINNNSENEQPIVYTSDVGKYYSETGTGINGIIFVDLAADGKETNPKQYETPLVYADGYNGIFGTREVITPVKGTTGNDRYYVMFIADVNTDPYSWYFNAKKTGISDTTLTSTDLGSGKQNTATMIEKWNASAYGEQKSNDMWSDAKQCITAGIDSVFIPSRDEWTTFIKVIGANSTNYSSMGLSQYYWTSSLSDGNHAYAINFENNTFIESDYGIGSFLPVRFASKE